MKSKQEGTGAPFYARPVGKDKKKKPGAKSSRAFYRAD